MRPLKTEEGCTAVKFARDAMAFPSKNQPPALFLGCVLVNRVS